MTRRDRWRGSPQTSKYRGVTRYERTGKWMAQFTVYVGYFHTEEAAARAYNEAAERILGPDAKLNIIDEPTDID